QGGREDAQRAIASANAAAEDWARAGAFDRAAAMHRVADQVERRHEGLVHTLTLDQGKPLAESRDEVEELVQYWRGAAEDAKRLEGRLPNSTSSGKRVLLLRRPRGVIGVAAAAAGKAAVLELGGNGPVVVLDDADLDLAAEATVAACFLCAGQSCTAGERLLVHRDVREEFVAKLTRLVVERVLLGDPFA